MCPTAVASRAAEAIAATGKNVSALSAPYFTISTNPTHEQNPNEAQNFIRKPVNTPKCSSQNVYKSELQHTQTRITIYAQTPEPYLKLPEHAQRRKNDKRTETTQDNSHPKTRSEQKP